MLNSVNNHHGYIDPDATNNHHTSMHEKEWPPHPPFLTSILQFDTNHLIVGVRLTCEFLVRY